MTDRIRVAITGYGNLGQGAERAMAQSPDLELVGIVTRRPPSSVTPLDPAVPVHHFDDVTDMVGSVDVMLCCGGSKDDLPTQGPALAKLFNVVDTFDTHSRIPEYFASMDAAARGAGHVAVISTGWDPGLFSLNRMMGEAILPEGETYTFWGRGVSQGHSDALRRVDGVAAGVQYTQPSAAALEQVRAGQQPKLTAPQSHTRHCFAVLDEGADPDAVREAIVTMPGYFADYETTVTFIDREELAQNHAAMPHGGVVLRSATTSDGMSHTIEFGLALGHNPSFTASVLVAYGRAAHRLATQGEVGAKTIFDVPPGLLSPRDPSELRRDLL